MSPRSWVPGATRPGSVVIASARSRSSASRLRDRVRRSLATLSQQRRHRLPAQVVQHRLRHHRVAHCIHCQTGQLERRVAETGQLVANGELAERELLRRLQWLVPSDRGRRVAVVEPDRQPTADVGGQVGGDRLAVGDRVAAERVLQPTANGGVVGLPHDRPGRQGRRVHVAAAEFDLDQLLRLGAHDEHATALFVLIRPTLVEHDAVAGLQRHHIVRLHVDDDALAGGRSHLSDTPATALGEAGDDQLLVVHAGQEPVAEPPAERLFEIASLLFADLEPLPMGSGVQRPAVGLRGGGDVVGALEAALDLQTRHAQGGKVADQVVRRQVLRGEQVVLVAQRLVFAVDDQLVWQPTRLGALPAVGAAAAEALAGQALPAVGDAERAVGEHLQRHRRGIGDLADVLDAQLARQHDALDAQRADELDAARLGQRHLRRPVYVQARRDVADQVRHAQVLHDDGVDARRGDRLDVVGGRRQLVAENEGVEREETLHVVVVQVGDDLRQIVQLEVGGTVPGIELVEPEVDGVRPVGNRGTHRVPIAGGGEQFGRASGWRGGRGEHRRIISPNGIRSVRWISFFAGEVAMLTAERAAEEVELFAKRLEDLYALVRGWTRDRYPRRRSPTARSRGRGVDRLLHGAVDDRPRAGPAAAVAQAGRAVQRGGPAGRWR